MKTFLLAIPLSFLNSKFAFLPPSYLLIIIFSLIALDFITGVLKSVVNNIPRTSKKYRETYAKYIQYMGAILMSFLLSFLIQESPQLKEIQFFTEIANNVILFGIITIEALSILENLVAVDNKSPFSRYIINPLYRLLTFELKNLFKKIPNDNEANPNS